jgi:hypothetical protein
MKWLLLALVLVGCTTQETFHDTSTQALYGETATRAIGRTNLTQIANILNDPQGYETYQETNWHGLIFLYTDNKLENEEIMNAAFIFKEHKIVLTTIDATKKRQHYQIVFSDDKKGRAKLLQLAEAFGIPKERIVY